MISEISSSVPTPPGSATNASPSSIIFALRSPMVSHDDKLGQVVLGHAGLDEESGLHADDGRRRPR